MLAKSVSLDLRPLFIKDFIDSLRLTAAVAWKCHEEVVQIATHLWISEASQLETVEDIVGSAFSRLDHGLQFVNPNKVQRVNGHVGTQSASIEEVVEDSVKVPVD